jgi:hypothetical protein
LCCARRMLRTGRARLFGDVVAAEAVLEGEVELVGAQQRRVARMAHPCQLAHEVGALAIDVHRRAGGAQRAHVLLAPRRGAAVRHRPRDVARLACGEPGCNLRGVRGSGGARRARVRAHRQRRRAAVAEQHVRVALERHAPVEHTVQRRMRLRGVGARDAVSLPLRGAACACLRGPPRTARRPAEALPLRCQLPGDSEAAHTHSCSGRARVAGSAAARDVHGLKNHTAAAAAAAAIGASVAGAGRQSGAERRRSGVAV